VSGSRLQALQAVIGLVLVGPGAGLAVGAPSDHWLRGMGVACLVIGGVVCVDYLLEPVRSLLRLRRGPES
jgi:hypothetical protein